MYSWNLSGRHRETIVARRPVVPEEAVRVCMIQPEDIAAFVLLAVQLPSRAVIEELIIRPR